MTVVPETGQHRDGGVIRPFVLWRLRPPRRLVSSAPLGGGLGERSWLINAQVATDYARTDPQVHLREIAAAAGLDGPGVGLLTAADLSLGVGEDGGVRVWATVGVTVPTWAAAADGAVSAWTPGTINVVALVPAALSDAALVNAVMTATEAKAQALAEAGVPGTGTASDAVCVLTEPGGPGGDFGGPRSVWGGRLARAVHTAVGTRLS